MEKFIIHFYVSDQGPTEVEANSSNEALEKYFSHLGYRIRNKSICSQVASNVSVRSTVSDATEYYYVRLGAIKNHQKTYLRKQREEIMAENWSSPHGQRINIPDFQQAKILYHGSRNGIRGVIRPISRDNCDFGSGFYTGDFRMQSELLVMDNGRAKLMYMLTADFQDLSVYTFDDEKDFVSWALYIAAKRRDLDIEKYPNIQALVQEIDQYDVVSGLIADDEMYQAFSDFLSGIITDRALVYCLSKASLGHQYVFKTQKACDQIRFLEIGPLPKENYVPLRALHKHLREETDHVVERTKEMKFAGRRLQDILEEYHSV